VTDPVRVEVYPVEGTGEFAHRFVFANGNKAGHRYGSRTDAARGARDLIEALQGSGPIDVVEVDE
jgi:hypothetical protein